MHEQRLRDVGGNTNAGILVCSSSVENDTHSVVGPFSSLTFVDPALELEGPIAANLNAYQKLTVKLRQAPSNQDVFVAGWMLHNFYMIRFESWPVIGP